MLMILSFQESVTRTRMGFVVFRYHDLLMRCDVVYHRLENKLWIRMPERWDRNKKERYSYWPNSHLSDSFQKSMINLLADKYNFTVERAAVLMPKAFPKKTGKKRPR